MQRIVEAHRAETFMHVLYPPTIMTASGPMSLDQIILHLEMETLFGSRNANQAVVGETMSFVCELRFRVCYTLMKCIEWFYSTGGGVWFRIWRETRQCKKVALILCDRITY